MLDCLLGALSEAIGITAILAILDLLATIGYRAIFTEAGERALKQILKSVFKRMLPIGIAILIAEILWHLYWCS